MNVMLIIGGIVFWLFVAMVCFYMSFMATLIFFNVSRPWKFWVRCFLIEFLLLALVYFLKANNMLWFILR